MRGLERFSTYTRARARALLRTAYSYLNALARDFRAHCVANETSPRRGTETRE